MKTVALQLPESEEELRQNFDQLCAALNEVKESAKLIENVLTEFLYPRMEQDEILRLKFNDDVFCFYRTNKKVRIWDEETGRFWMETKLFRRAQTAPVISRLALAIKLPTFFQTVMQI